MLRVASFIALLLSCGYAEKVIMDSAASLASAQVMKSTLVSSLNNMTALLDQKRRKVHKPLVAASWVSTREVKQSLKDVLELGAGKGQTKLDDVNIKKLKDQLRPLFNALPKNHMGLLGHSTVRYALHRHFVHHHGMYIKGLEPAGELWNSSSPSQIMEDRVPAFVQHLFEERLTLGFDLQELALLAAALEHFIHTEDTQRLEHVYRISGQEAGIKGKVNSNDLISMLDIYVAMLITGEEGASMTKEDGETLVQAMPQDIPSWEGIQGFVRVALATTLSEEHGKFHPPIQVSFETARKVVSAIGEGFGKHQDGECRDMAKKLYRLEEHPGQGRVRMERFYAAGRQFKETEKYLDMLGAIDKRESHTYVVVPNYILSATNCVAATRLYSVCCMDPCESIMRHLETEIQKPKGRPEDIIELVGHTMSLTVHAARKLSPTLKQHLVSISKNNRGWVPLHGRLFAQWLHHAFPQECPYPAKAGTSRPVVPEDWFVANNITAALSENEARVLAAEERIAKVKDLADGDMSETLPWDEDEELVFHHTRPSLDHELAVLCRAAAALTIIASCIWGITEVAKPMLKNIRTNSKAYV